MCCYGAQELLEFYCFRRGKWCGEFPALIAIIHRTDHAGGPPHCLPYRFEQVSRGGLAARAGHANQREPSAGTAVQTVGHETKKETWGARGNRCYPPSDGCSWGDDHRASSTLTGLVDKANSVVLRAGKSKK